MRYPYLTEGAIEAQATALLRAAFGPVPRSPTPVDLIDVVCYLSEAEQLQFDDDAALPPERGETVLGKTLPIRGRILLNRALKLDPDPGRATFTLAHEIGHWVLHRKLFLALLEQRDLFAGPAQVSADVELVALNKAVFPGSCRPGAVAPEEWQANHFAAALLIDQDVLREEFVARWGDPPVAWATQQWRYQAQSVRGLARVLAKSPTWSRGPLREVFGLSVEAVAIALESRGYVVERAPAL